jgi:hypothetical protein
LKTKGARLAKNLQFGRVQVRCMFTIAIGCIAKIAPPVGSAEASIPDKQLLLFSFTIVENVEMIGIPVRDMFNKCHRCPLSPSAESITLFIIGRASVDLVASMKRAFFIP